jgi:predicted ATPase/DNA-binding SARP family transcriptional activator/DNA-binding CsgD family transcriptional regulator
MDPPAGSKGVRQSVGSTGGTETLRIKLLGDFSVSVGSRTIQRDAWRLRKAAALVKLLALAPRHRLHREQVMDALWPDSGRKAASNSLRKTLYVARRALDPVEGSRYLASENDSLVLRPGSSSWVHVDAFEEAAATARREHEPAAYRVALDLYAGDLLPEDRYEEWAEDCRQELRRMFLSLLFELANVHEERAEHGQSVEALRRAVAEEPTLEEAHAGLMRLFALLGQEGEALAQYEQLREALSRQLGAEPGSATNRLRDEITSGESRSALSSPTGPPQEEKPLHSSRHNLPTPRTSFVGREREIVEVKRELVMTRLLTLTGVGGSGKSRLALEVSRDSVGAYPDGVWLVELAPLSEMKVVPQAVARAMRVREQPGRPIIDILTEALHKKTTLLVLDNCEHLAHSVADLIDTLLDSCSHLRVLTTSRKPLGVEDEVVWRVSSLSTPYTDPLPPAGVLMRYEAVRLFVERTRLRLSAFELTPQNVTAVAEVCRKLEGIPLAIELAAARMDVLTAEQIAQRLHRALGLLTGGRASDRRHRTLRATLDWSHELLSEPERKLFRRLSVFAGGWTLEAGEAVGAGDGIDEGDVVESFLMLLDKSLVVSDAGEDGFRYGMLEPIRQYARERLEESGEAQAMKRAHAEYFLALAEEAEPKLWESGDKAWFARIEKEHDNMRVALAWAIEYEEAELALRLGGALRWFWRARGYYGEGRRWLERALSEEGRTSAEARAKALDGVGWMASEQRAIERAEAAAQEGLKLCEKAGIGGVIAADFKNLLGEAAWLRGDYERAAKLVEEGLVLHRVARNTRGIAWSVCSLANTSSELGDYERSKELFEEGIALARKMGGALPLGDLLMALGYEYLLEGDHERATALSEEAAELYRKRGSRGGLKYALYILGWAALLRENHERAKALLEENLMLCKEIGAKVIGSLSVEGLACSAVSRGEARRAARLFGVAATLRESVDYQQPPRERTLGEPYLAPARSRLSEADWEGTFAEGKNMGLEEAVEYALSEEGPATPLTTVPDQSSAEEPPPSLTRREWEVANLLERRFTNRQIASELHLSVRTVNKHVANILRKLNLRSRTQVDTTLRWVRSGRTLSKKDCKGEPFSRSSVTVTLGLPALTLDPNLGCAYPNLLQN